MTIKLHAQKNGHRWEADIDPEMTITEIVGKLMVDDPRPIRSAVFICTNRFATVNVTTEPPTQHTE